MKTSGKKMAYDHDSIRSLYVNDDWVDEDKLRNKKQQKNKSKNKRFNSKEDLYKD